MPAKPIPLKRGPGRPTKAEVEAREAAQAAATATLEAEEDDLEGDTNDFDLSELEGLPDVSADVAALDNTPNPIQALDISTEDIGEVLKRTMTKTPGNGGAVVVQTAAVESKVDALMEQVTALSGRVDKKAIEQEKILQANMESIRNFLEGVVDILNAQKEIIADIQETLKTQQTAPVVAPVAKAKEPAAPADPLKGLRETVGKGLGSLASGRYPFQTLFTIFKKRHAEANEENVTQIMQEFGVVVSDGLVVKK